MKKYLLAPAVILLSASVALAEYSYGEFSGTSCTFMETPIHSAPDPNSPEITLLPAGQKIEILNKMEMEHEVSGLSLDWYEVAFLQEGVSLSGFASSATFACTSVEFDRELFFTAAVTGFNPETGLFSGTASVISDSEIIASTEIEPPRDLWGTGGRFIYTLRSRIIEEAAFSGVEKVLVLEFIYEACGYENMETPVFFTGTELVAGPCAISVYEAMIFHQTAELLFSPESNTVTLRTEIEHWDEETEAYTTVRESDENWLWSGTEFLVSI